MRTASRPFCCLVKRAGMKPAPGTPRASVHAFADAQHAFVAPTQGIGGRLGTDPGNVTPRRHAWRMAAVTAAHAAAVALLCRPLRAQRLFPDIPDPALGRGRGRGYGYTPGRAQRQPRL
ncbi:hypothetical protein D3C86_720120 [compost metagenome]